MTQPEKKIRAGAISATVWNNEAVNQKGELNYYTTVSIERSYKDKEGKWQSTNSMRVSDLPKAAMVLNKAYEYVLFREKGEAME